MNLDELRAVRRKERQKDSLQHLRDSFYTDVAEYIQNLKAERREAASAADDPFSSPEVGRLTDEIETAEEVVEAVYERRVGKVVKLSSFAAADMSADEEGLTAEERELFDDLVGRIKHNRSTVLDILGGEGPSSSSDAGDADAAAKEGTADGDSDPTPDTGTGPGVEVDVNPEAPDGAPSAAPPETPESGSEMSPGADPGSTNPVAGSDAPTPADDDGDDVLADAMGAGDGSDGGTDGVGGSSADATPSLDSADAPRAEGESPTAGAGDTDDATAATEGDAGADRTTVRLTRDVGRIFGVDEREYELADEDVVTLPTPNAEPLIERDAAERIE